MARRTCTRDLWFVLLAACVCAGTAQAGPGAFRVTVSPLHLDGRIACVLATGLQGGGAGEVAVGFVSETRTGEVRKRVAFFRPGPDGRYGPKPARVLAVPADAGVVDFEDVNGDGLPDLVVTRRGALWAFFRKPDGAFHGEPRRILAWPYNLPYAREHLFSLPLFRDGNHDGRPDVLLPTPNGYALFCQAPDGAYPDGPDDLFPLDYGAALSGMFQGNTLGIHHMIPRPRALDVDRDGWDDLVFADGNLCSFFRFDPATGRYDPARTVRLPVRKEGIQFLVSEADDFDGDGLPDVFVMRGVTRKVTFNLDYRFFRCGPGLALEPGQGRAFARERQIIPPWILDLDGDGRKEFVTFSQRLSLNSVIDYFIRDRVAVDVGVHPNRGGAFLEEPVVVRKVFLKVQEEEGRPGAVEGDFNGDGRDDLVYTPDAGRLHYLLCGGEALVPDAPSLDLEVPSYGHRVVEDFNGDGRDDLAVIYEVEKREGDLTILISGVGDDQEKASIPGSERPATGSTPPPRDPG